MKELSVSSSRVNSLISNEQSYQNVLRGDIAEAERDLEDSKGLDVESRAVEIDIKDKESNIERIQREIIEAKYEDYIAEKTNRIRELENQQEIISSEMALLNEQADARAELSLQCDEVKRKDSEMKNM